MKIWDLIKGKDVHREKSKYTASMVKIQAQARAQVRKSKETNEKLENSVAYKIAQATGNYK